MFFWRFVVVYLVGLSSLSCPTAILSYLLAPLSRTRSFEPFSFSFRPHIPSISVFFNVFAEFPFFFFRGNSQGGRQRERSTGSCAKFKTEVNCQRGPAMAAGSGNCICSISSAMLVSLSGDSTNIIIVAKRFYISKD